VTELIDVSDDEQQPGRLSGGAAFGVRRALTQGQLVEGTRRFPFEELTDWTLWADKTLKF
jgi:hypothetical protein